MVGIKFDFINHHFKLDFVDSGLYDVQDENNFIYPSLQVRSGFGSDENVSNPAGQKSRDPDPHPWFYHALNCFDFESLSQKVVFSPLLLVVGAAGLAQRRHQHELLRQDCGEHQIPRAGRKVGNLMICLYC